MTHSDEWFSNSVDSLNIPDIRHIIPGSQSYTVFQIVVPPILSIPECCSSIHTQCSRVVFLQVVHSFSCSCLEFAVSQQENNREPPNRSVCANAQRTRGRLLVTWCAYLHVPVLSTEKLLIAMDAGKYHFVNQGAITVDTIDDKEEMRISDVCMRER